MRLLLSFLLVSIIHQASGQICAQLIYHGNLPNPLYDNDTAALKVNVSCNEYIELQQFTLSQNGSAFTLDLYYCHGMTQVATTAIDTFTIGVLPYGQYSYVINIYDSDSSVTNCLTYTFAGNGSATFMSMPYINTILEENSDEFNFYPNPNNGYLYLSNSNKIESIFIYSLDGKLIEEINKIESEIHLSDKIINGHYFIQFEMKDGQRSRMKKLIISE